jgi:hypothetical protein
MERSRISFFRSFFPLCALSFLFFVTLSAVEGLFLKKQKRMPLQSGLRFPLTKNELSGSATQQL